MAHVLHGGRHLLDLVNEVLDIASIEAGRMELTFEPVGVNATFEEIVALVRPLALRRNITIDVHCAEQSLLAAAVQTDQQRFKQVLLNLLSNAIKYNHHSGRVDLVCERAETEGRLRLKVRDTGYGISAEDLPKLFAPFERLNASTYEVEGTGIGLAISKQLAAALGGSLEAQSVLGQGSTFSLELPEAQTSGHPAGTRASQPIPPARKTAEKSATHTVLYIEDNLSNLLLIQQVFSHRSEINLLSAMRGSEGLKLAREHRPDLILLDLQLPDLPGDALLRALKEDERTRRIPVVMVSADATPTQVERLEKLGADAYLTKPIQIPAFLSTVDRTLALKD